ncbi:uncharacterized protein LY89DRAFT_479656 [Mollisia scopiformis]|uniref:Uncharacterized protein n=1 Tax=Mollisia scopiformis TaxID=149040 RepID=A0A194XGC7_MOLSC|nr:uncharacterized protein LY89DRAFT_479656 [Mollisia scopiformis]KUJ19191.1 hypothetical protein LY89DRAFT_479656 [Mollisia scopiformis]
MKFAFNTSLLALAGLAFTAVASAIPTTVTVPSGSGYKNYPLGVMTFSGTIGGHAVQLNGTIQEINTQMVANFPDFNMDALVAANLAKREAEAEAATPANLFTRSKSGMLCWPVPSQDWSLCSVSVIGQGITYLDNFNGLCGVGANSCVRISCSYSSAIYLCNDNDYGITPTCPYMGSYAQDIINDCSHCEGPNDCVTCGQEFDSDNYNIIVRDNC